MFLFQILSEEKNILHEVCMCVGFFTIVLVEFSCLLVIYRILNYNSLRNAKERSDVYQSFDLYVSLNCFWNLFNKNYNFIFKLYEHISLKVQLKSHNDIEQCFSNRVSCGPEGWTWMLRNICTYLLFYPIQNVFMKKIVNL